MGYATGKDRSTSRLKTLSNRCSVDYAIVKGVESDMDAVKAFCEANDTPIDA